jgi:ribosomal protein L10
MEKNPLEKKQEVESDEEKIEMPRKLMEMPNGTIVDVTGLTVEEIQDLIIENTPQK